MNKSIKQALYLIILAVVVIALIFACHRLFVVYSAHPDELGFEGYYDYEPDTLDILFFGNSHGFMGINNIYMEQELEVDTFQVKGRSGTIEAIYYQLEQSLRTQQPDIIVLEMFCMFDDNFENEEERERTAKSRNHWIFDTFRFSRSKIEGINTNVKKGERLEYYFPLAYTHTRWKDAKILDNLLDMGHDMDLNEFNGFMPYYLCYSSVYDNYMLPVDTDEEPMPVSEKKLDHFIKFIELCEDNDIEILFVTMPFEKQLYFTNQEMYNTIKYLEDSMNLSRNHYVDFNSIYKDLDLDLSYYYDKCHMNIAGATKAAQYLSEYINENMSEELSDANFDYKAESDKKYDKLNALYEDFEIQRKSMLYQTKMDTLRYPGNIIEYLNNTKHDRYYTIVSSNNYDLDTDDDTVLFLTDGMYIPHDYDKNANFVTIVNSGEEVLQIALDDVTEINPESSEIKGLKLPFGFEIKNNGAERIVKINENECTLNKTGYNILVYDAIFNRVVSQADFDINNNTQHYFNRESAQQRYDSSSIIYEFDTSSAIERLKCQVLDDGLMITPTNKIVFDLKGYIPESNHIMLKAEIVCSHAALFEVRFNSAMEREQMVTGNNTVYIEMKLDSTIEDVHILLPNERAEYLIKSIEICDLSN